MDGGKRRMGSFGDRLKKEREQRGVTLEDISLNTKIGTRLLRALEDEKFDQLPGGIFNKGFVRAYARHLGLDEDQTIADYMEALGAGRPNPEPEALPIPAPVDRRDSTPSQRQVRGEQDDGRTEVPWGLLAILLLVVALAFASWSYFHRAPQMEKSRGPASTAETLSEAGAVLNADTRSAGAPERGPSVPETANVPATSPIPATEQSNARVSPVAQAALHGAAPPVAGGTFTVVLKGNDDAEECWVSIVVDGQPPIEAILVAPHERVIHGQSEVVVKAGSAGALDVLFNGKKLPSLGDYGEVRTLTFHPDGLQPPAVKPVVPASR